MTDEQAQAERFAELFRAVYLTFHRRDGPRSQLAGASRAVLEHLALAGPLTVGEAAAHLSRAQARRHPDVTRQEIECQTLEYMATMPAWQDHPRVAATVRLGPPDQTHCDGGDDHQGQGNRDTPLAATPFTPASVASPLTSASLGWPQRTPFSPMNVAACPI